MMNDKLEIDGSQGEGGGAILRLSAGLSILFNRSIKIKNIRANRPKSGLRLQHLLGLETLTKLTNSTLSECKVGTRELTFVPNNQINPTVNVNIATAANIGLLLQPIQIAGLGFKGRTIEINLSGGGTYGKWAPGIDYLKNVTYKIFKKSGLNLDINIQKHGFYPKGGARMKCLINPPTQKLKPLNLTDLGTVDLIQGKIIITNQLRRARDSIGDRIRKSVKRQIKRDLNIETDIRYKYVDSTSPGVGLFLWANSDTGAIISTGTILGEKHISSEKLGIMAVDELTNYIKHEIPVDNYLSDQLIPLMAYVKGTSEIKVLKITSHTKTNLELIKLFTRREYKINQEKDGSIIIEYI